MNNQQRIAVRQALRILGGCLFYNHKADYEKVFDQINGAVHLANHQLTPEGLYPKDLDLIFHAALHLWDEQTHNDIKDAA